MLFPTYIFFAFFIVIFALNWLLKKWPLAWKLFLIAASYAFYATWDIRFVGVLCGVTLWNFILVHLTHKFRSKRARSLLLFLTIIGNIFCLLLFKYYDFFRVSFENLLTFIGFSASLPVLDLLLPVGLSFYILRAISYDVDAFRGGVPPSSFIDFAIYISFFPQLLSGPIARPGEFLPQLKGGGSSDIDNPHEYFALILSGLFKKVVIASYFTVLIDPLFAVPENYSRFEILAAVYSYAIVIYCDFSGYSDMAIGIAGLLGFRSPVNFNRPYFSASIQEFWRRWHISFSEWLRDYIYIPLGGNRKGRLRQATNSFATMIVSGLWHGASVNFIIWGALHGAALGAQRFFKTATARFTKRGAATRLLAWLLTFHFICFAWIFFRSQTLDDAGAILHSFFSSRPAQGTLTLGVIYTILGTFLLFLFEKQIITSYATLEKRLPFIFQPILFALVVVLIIQLGPEIIPPFIYFQF